MAHIFRNCGKVAKAVLKRPTTPQQSFNSGSINVRIGRVMESRGYAAKTAEGKVDCACARHPWPDKEVSAKAKQKQKDCDFDFRKMEVNPYDLPCDCKDPPPAAGCADVGRPKEVCCRSTRQYGCFCEEEEDEECEEEEEEVVSKGCDLDFRKLEVNPYDEPCECHDPPPASSCESLANRPDVCCRTPVPFGCDCDAYNDPGLPCLKPKGPKAKKQKKECDKKKFGVKCL
ncbi:hypothetical protein J6590_001853 [Homalodisca vitripennis]|nr:hypothetical protein J6590_001853 [Homalodisca vitripennis]